MTSSIRKRGQLIRDFILNNVDAHPADIGRFAASHFKITRQAAHRHIRNLVSEGILRERGRTKARLYQLQPVVDWYGTYEISSALDEDKVWRDDVVPLIETLPNNVREIWHYAFTEMFNNAIDHSEGKHISVFITRDVTSTKLSVMDDGVGIFRKICQRFGLEDQRHAVLELAKGKLTTDPARHTGEGIFFTSRIVDEFWIISDSVYFSHEIGQPEDWIFDLGSQRPHTGTSVDMLVKNNTTRTEREIFDKYASPETDDYGFTKTVVPVRLARYGDDQLVSRSQAKRMLSRVDRFKTVMLDFTGVERIGQAFADETFRVFAKAHPEVELVEMRESAAVRQMIDRARANALLNYTDDSLPGSGRGTV